MELNTDKQRQGLKTLMKLAGMKPIEKRVACSYLTRGDEPIYKRSRDASSFIKDVLESDKFPISAKSSKIVRQDVDYGGVK